MADIRKTVFNLLGIFNAVRAINEKYKHPRIKMTRMVSLSLLALRIYLLFILLVLLYKFISITAIK